MNPLYLIRTVSLIVIGLFCAGTLAVAQIDPVPVAAPGMSGTEYYVAFAQCDEANAATSRFMGLYITSEVATSGSVEVMATSEVISFTTKPGQTTRINLTDKRQKLELDTSRSEEKSKAGVRITSRAPVSVFVMNARFQTGAGYAAVPVSLWDNKYTALTLPNATSRRSSQFVIVAAYDDTRIQYVPTATTYRVDKRVSSPVVTLMRGETYLVQALPQAAQIGVADLSGTVIQSSKPVGIISGHIRTPITADGRIPFDNVTYASHQAAMLLPESRWGDEYFSVPMREGGDRFRVMPAHDGTKITVRQFRPDGGFDQQQLTLDGGEVYDLLTIDGQAITHPVYWEATSPTMVMQLRTSGSYPNPANSPMMIPLSPIDRATIHSSFVAPEEIGGGVFVDHTLMILAKGDPLATPENPGNPLRGLLLDGQELHTLAPEILTQKIGSTGWYYVKVKVKSGSHVITSKDGYPFTGYISGHNDSAFSRDSYLWALPYWLEQLRRDAEAPYVDTSHAPMKGIVMATVSDRTEFYFSGIEDVDVAPSSKGWQRVSFSTPAPDDDAPATFRAIADPSGPLDVVLRDRDGNTRTMNVSPGICFKTAIADKSSVTITTSKGLSRTATIRLQTNICGDSARVKQIRFDNGNASAYLSQEFSGQTSWAPFTIAPNGWVDLTLTSSTDAPEGTYTAETRITVDDSTLVVPITLVVGPPSSVREDEGAQIAIYPNPFTSFTTIALAEPLSPSGRVTITDRLGGIVRQFDGAELNGQSHLTWNGVGSDGAQAPAGFYLVTVADRTQRTVRGITLVR